MSADGASVGVLLDGARIGQSDGHGRAVRELAWALDRHAPGIDLTVVTTPRGAAVARSLLDRARVEVADERPLPVWEQVTLPAVARRLGVAVVHFTRESAAWAWPREASVVTLVGPGPEAPMPSGLPLCARVPFLYRGWTWQAVGRHAAGLVSPDEATAAAVLARFGRPTTVVQGCVDGFASRHPPATDRATSPRRYLLHCAGAVPGANTARVVDAYLALRVDRPDLSLEIVGLSSAQVPAAAREVPGIHVRGRLADASLAQLYHGAAAVVTPRLDGRDGSTVLEGFAFGVPVVAAAHAGSPELVRDEAALRVDPTSTQAIVTATAAVLDDPVLRERLRARGTARLEQHGARRVATTLTDLYRRLVLSAPPLPVGSAR